MRPLRFLLSAWFLVLSLLVAGCATSPGKVSVPKRLPRDAIRPVIAVSSFDNRSGFSGQWNIGSGMADLLVAELMGSERFTVVERAHLDKVVSELNRQRNPHFRTEGRVNGGRLKNAHFLIRGVVSDFSQIGGGSFFAFVRNLFVRSMGNRARVAMTLTVVNVESGEIVGSTRCSGMTYTSRAFLQSRYKNVDFGGDTFMRTPLGTATTKAIRRGVRGVARTVPITHWQPMIADIIDNRVVLNGGENRGIAVGREFGVRGQGRSITDPATGDVLSVIPGPAVGHIRVVEVLDRISYAEILKGKGLKRGQRLVGIKRPSD